MNNCFIILAAGKSKRFNSKIPKTYHIYKGKSLIEHSIDKAISCKKFKKIVIVINKKHKKFIKKLNIKKAKIINGGKSRAESSYKALKYIKKYNINNVLIHDAARPNFTIKLIENLIKNLKKNKSVVPVIKTNNTVKFKNNNKLTNIDRNKIYLTQTPQAFDYKTLLMLQKKQHQK